MISKLKSAISLVCASNEGGTSNTLPMLARPSRRAGEGEVEWPFEFDPPSCNSMGGKELSEECLELDALM
jgi:hypothetical protein